MRAWLLGVVLLLALSGGCGGSGGADHGGTRSAEASHPEAPEASPEAPPSGPEASGEVPGTERAALTAVVTSYIAALDDRDASAVCALFAPGALEPAELPRRRGGCEGSLRASLGVRPPHGGPAWRRTELHEAKAARVGDGRARVTATVTHRFSDRDYVSVEDDVIYLERLGDRWVLAKPSGTLYRAVGYPEPPLRALSPPPGWG
jgi:hypothetical protein